jgi:hypothetical protein
MHICKFSAKLDDATWDEESPLQKLTHTVSQVLMPFLYACSRMGKASSSFNTQGCHSELPKPMVPKMTLDTFRPDFPRLHDGQRMWFTCGYGTGATYLTYCIFFCSVIVVAMLFRMNRNLLVTTFVTKSHDVGYRDCRRYQLELARNVMMAGCGVVGVRTWYHNVCENFMYDEVRINASKPVRSSRGTSPVCNKRRTIFESQLSARRRASCID